MDDAAKALLGRRIAAVRRLTKEEMNGLMWYGTPPVVMILDDGTALIPSRDPEGNGPGALFGFAEAGDFTL